MATALSRTLMIPELVSTCISFLRDDRNALYACLTIDKFWNQESTKLLWERCGYGVAVLVGQWKPPLVRHLAALSHNEDRLQWYASCIRELCFDTEDSNSELPPPENAKRDEVRFHRVFKKVHFAHLERISFRSSEYGHHFNKASSLIQYLQPSLKRSCLIGGSLSDEFFVSMRTQCPRLETLVLNLEGQKKGRITESVVLESLEATRYLSYLEIKPDFGSKWSSKVLASIARHPNIITLMLPEIAEDWWKDLECLPRQKLFQKVTKFSAGLTDAGMQMLSPHIKDRITSLEVLLLLHSTHAVGIAARMPLLTILALTFGFDDVINAQDLMMLSDGCKRLPILELGGREDFHPEHPRGEDITDTTIEYIATRLPNLEEIQFNIQDSPLTEKSLISLGAHCKSLEGVYLSAEVSFEKLVQDTQPNHFPTLASVSLTQTDPEVGQCEDARTTVGLLLERAPALNGLDFASSDGTDWELQAAINELVNIRRAPYLNKPPADEDLADKKTKAETVPHDGF